MITERDHARLHPDAVMVISLGDRRKPTVARDETASLIRSSSLLALQANRYNEQAKLNKTIRDRGVQLQL